jgi:hypothetical protein
MFAAIGAGSAMTGAAISLAVAGSAMTAISSIKQGQAAKTAAEYNAAVSNNNAMMAEQQAQSQAMVQGRRAMMQSGGLLANMAANGVEVGEGSPLDILSQSAANAEMDRQNIIYNGRVKAMSLRNQAQLDILQGETAQSNGYMSAAGSLLQGGASAAGMYAGVGKGTGSTIAVNG